MRIRAKSFAVVAGCALVAGSVPASQAHHNPGSYGSGIRFVYPGKVEYGVPFEIKFDLRNAALGVYDYGSMWCRGATLFNTDDGKVFYFRSPVNGFGYFENTGEFDFISWEVVARPDAGYKGEHGEPFCEFENEGVAEHMNEDPWWYITFPVFYETEAPAPESAPVDISNVAARSKAVRFDLSQRATIAARVKDSAGIRVRSASFTRKAGTRYWRWNPRDSFQPDRYRIILVATDKAGGRDVDRTSFRIRR